ncbi:MAG: MFS transporter [Verrucomicrobiota bacterium]|nr:MFS transporter [Verrucomicrobiota bacterium]
MKSDLETQRDEKTPRVGFRDVLRVHDFRCLWIGQIISSIGDRFYQFALLSIIFGIEAGQKAGPEAARIFLFSLLPGLLLGPFVGVPADLFNRQKVMVVSDVLRAILVVFIALIWTWTGSLKGVYFILFIMGIMSHIFIPARQASLPGLVPQHQLMMANSLSAAAGIIANCLGVLLVTLYLAVFSAGQGAMSCFYLNAAALLLSAVFILRIKADLKPERHEHPFQSLWHELTGGFHEIVTDRLTFTLVVLSGAFTFILGLFVPVILGFIADPTIINYAGWDQLAGSLETFLRVFSKTGPTIEFKSLALGVLTVAMALGVAGGMWVVAKVPKISHKSGLPYLSFFIMGVAVFIMSGLSNYTLLVLCVVVLGMSAGGVMIPVDTRLQMCVSNARRGRVFAARGMVFAAAFIVPQLLLISGHLFRWAGPAKLMMIIGVVTACLASLLYLAVPKDLRTGSF